MKVEVPRYKKVRRISILAILALILIPSFFSLTQKIITAIKTQAAPNLEFEKIEIEFENIYSNDLKKQIQAFVQSQITQTNLLSFDQNKFYKELKDSFKIIKTFDSQINSKILNIKIVGVTPICTVNKDLVLGNKKQLFEPKYFEQFDLTKLENISIDKKSFNNPINKELYGFIKQIPTQDWQNFQINFIKKTEIYLTPKNPALKYCLVTNKKTIFDEQKITKAEQLYRKLIHDEKFIKKMKTKNHIFLMDLRFKNCIVTRFQNRDQDREGGV